MAIIPPQKVYDVIKSHQRVMSEQFDSHKSYHHIPHLTLVPPFRTEEVHQPKIYELIQGICDEVESFPITIDRFGCFGKHTIFAEAEPSEKLEQLHHRLLTSLNKKEELLSSAIHYFQRYHPHITVGYRDLKDTFKEAWAYFENLPIHEKFTCTEVVLLRHDDEKWEIIAQFPFRAGRR